MPTAISTSGEGRLNRRQNPVTAMTVATSTTSPNAISTRPFSSFAAPGPPVDL